MPEVQKLELLPLFEKLKASHRAAYAAQEAAKANPANNQDATSGESKPAANPVTLVDSPTSPHLSLCVVLATDGVWDNWMYEDINKFVMDISCLNAVVNSFYPPQDSAESPASGDGGKRVASSLMQRNAIYSRRNFGNQADNATGIVLYLRSDQE